jgi:hypothetical protein
MMERLVDQYKVNAYEGDLRRLVSESCAGMPKPPIVTPLARPLLV